jgi:hypothetical protein
VAQDRRWGGNNHSHQQAQGHAQTSRGAEGPQTGGGGRMGLARNRGHQSRQASRQSGQASHQSHQASRHESPNQSRQASRHESSRQASRHESPNHVKDLPREVDVYRSVLLADAGASTQAKPGV